MEGVGNQAVIGPLEKLTATKGRYMLAQVILTEKMGLAAMRCKFPLILCAISHGNQHDFP